MAQIKTTHVGSLPRPEALAAMLRARHQGQAIDTAAFDAALRQAVAECVAQQVASGIDIVSDGEMSKVSYAYYVQDRLSGMEPAEAAEWQHKVLHRFQRLDMDYMDFPDYATFRARMTTGPASARPPICTGPLSYRDTGAVESDLAVLGEAVAVSGARSGFMPSSFMTAASPGVIAMFASQTSHYATEDEYVFALAEAMRPEYEAIHRAGVILQVDCPDLTLAGRMRYVQDGVDPHRIVARNIEAVNIAIANIPGDRVRLHLCWGNYAGPHTCDVDAARLFPLLRETRARALSFEAANPRHEHEWEDWARADLPDDMVLIPGVIDSVSNFVEHPRLVAQRINHFTDAVGHERVIAGTDCGFGTFALATPTVFPSIVWGKLRALAEGAALAG